VNSEVLLKESTVSCIQHIMRGSLDPGLMWSFNNCITAAKATQPPFAFSSQDIVSFSFLKFSSKERDLVHRLNSNQQRRTLTVTGLQVSTTARCTVQFYTKNKIPTPVSLTQQ